MIVKVVIRWQDDDGDGDSNYEDDDSDGASDSWDDEEDIKMVVKVATVIVMIRKYH